MQRTSKNLLALFSSHHTTKTTNNGIVERISRRLFFKGLKKKTSPEMIFKFLSEFGKVIKLNVPFSKTTKKNMGYGFVQFESIEVCKKLLEIR